MEQWLAPSAAPEKKVWLVGTTDMLPTLCCVCAGYTRSRSRTSAAAELQAPLHSTASLSDVYAYVCV